jgi:peptidoglycan hydrolase-like protein with peptidoglycan-binding domain
MRIQLSLNARGYCNCAIDGKFGQGTQTALKKFQKDSSLKVTGLPDTETLNKLNVEF